MEEAGAPTIDVKMEASVARVAASSASESTATTSSSQKAADVQSNTTANAIIATSSTDTTSLLQPSGAPSSAVKTQTAGAAANPLKASSAAVRRASSAAAVCSDDIVGECHTKLIPEYGVIHLKNALNDQGQQQLWNLMKPRVYDPSDKATGFHAFTVCAKDHKDRKRVKRIPKVDAFGKFLFALCADALSATLSVDTTDEPSYQRLLDLANGSKPFDPGECIGVYYRADARLFNHTDAHEILFTMTLAIGDDCDFHIGKPYKKTWLNERNGVVKKIRMRSGDAVFFDGGSIPHEVVRIREGTGPSWWNDAKVPHGSRLVMVFREQEQNFYRNKIKNEKKKKKNKKVEGKTK